MEAAADMADIVPKGEFAKILNVSAGRVSQYISEEKIFGPAIVGHGRSAKINVPVARQQLRRGLDVSQSLGNGLGTQLGEAAPVSDHPDVPDTPLKSSTEDKIREEKLKAERLRVRRLEEEEAARRGRYILAVDARAEHTRQAGLMLKVFEGGLADMASALAAQFKLPQRDVLHGLKAAFRKVRDRASKDFEAAAAELPDAIGDDDDDIEG